MAELIRAENFIERKQAADKVIVAVVGFTQSEASYAVSLAEDLPDDFTVVWMTPPDHDLICVSEETIAKSSSFAQFISLLRAPFGSKVSMLSHADPLTWPSKFKKVVDEIVEVAGSPVGFVGHSTGARLADNYATDHPENVQGIVALVSPPRRFRPTIEAFLSFILKFDFSMMTIGITLFLAFVLAFLAGEIHLGWFAMATLIIPGLRFIFRFIPAPKSFKDLLSFDGTDFAFKKSVPLFTAARLLVLFNRLNKNLPTGVKSHFFRYVLGGDKDQVSSKEEMLQFGLERYAKTEIVIGADHFLLTKMWTVVKHGLIPAIENAFE